MLSPAIKPRPDTIKVRWDIVLFFAYVFAAMKRSTGLLWHEWLGVVFIPVLLVHLWLNWNWIVDFVQRPTRALSRATRFNRWWNALQLFVAVVALGSGLLVSRYFLPALGLPGMHGYYLNDVHACSATILTLMIGVHLGLHVHWIRSKLSRSPNTMVDSGAKPRRSRLSILLVTVLVLGSVLAFSYTDFYHQHYSLFRRFRDDFGFIIIQIMVPTLLTFGILIFARRRRRLKLEI
jgi:hypothetical protein